MKCKKVKKALRKVKCDGCIFHWEANSKKKKLPFYNEYESYKTYCERRDRVIFNNFKQNNIY